MTDRSATHDTFVIERRYDASPARVFAAWATAEAKAAWFVGPSGWRQLERVLDFRVGGEERVKGAFPGGRITDFRSRYFDIVQDRRIVHAYAMHLDDVKISVSLATIEFHPDGAGTRLVLTEQGAFLDGYDDAGSRDRGTRGLLEQLAAALDRAA
jgi:uncharacterized protein YndB with AHSA1/START domain